MSEAPTVEQVRANIEALDLEPILVKLIELDGPGWSLEYARMVEKWYRRFLLLSFTQRNRPVVVNEAIDTFWHQHILDTRKYAADCEMMFGYFLHHFPYFGMRGDEDARNLQAAYGETMALMKDTFGESVEEDFGSRWDKENRPTRTDTPRFKGASCSDCDHFIPPDDDGRQIFNAARPRLTQKV